MPDMVSTIAMQRGSGTRRAFIMPGANADESAFVQETVIYLASTWLEVCAHFTALDGEGTMSRHQPAARAEGPTYLDFFDLKGQQISKRALEAAAAGCHSVLKLCEKTPKENKAVDGRVR